MLDKATTLGQIADGELVEAVCGKCRESLGRYEVQDRGDGSIALYDDYGAAPLARVSAARTNRRSGMRGPRTGARRVIVEHFEDRTYLRWRCGCGADIRRRSDRLGQLEVTRTNGRLTLVL